MYGICWIGFCVIRTFPEQYAEPLCRASRVKVHCLLPLRKEVQEWNSEQKRLETASGLRCFLIVAREGSQASSRGGGGGLGMTGLGRKGPSLPL